MRFVTAPSRSRKRLSDAYSIRAGAVTNRTYRVGAKRLQTTPTALELAGYKPHLPPIPQGYLVLGFRVYFITNVSAICLF